MRSGKDHVVVLRRGDEIIGALEKYARDNDISAASFTGIGAVGNAIIGAFNTETKEYMFEEQEGDIEVLNMTGNITLDKDRQMVHAHVTLMSQDWQSGDTEISGGHLKRGVVSVTMEIFLRELNTRLERKFDESIGLKLIR